jgi:RHS repeat-associated protein
VGYTASQTFQVVHDLIAPMMVITVPTVVPVRFTVAFSATDAEAGVRHYTVQYRVEGGSWADWLVETLQSEADFVGTPGEVYYFRAQAIDKVNNLSEWVEVGPVEVKAVTKYYTFNGQRVAMRQGDEVYYLHGDHLGSTSLTTDASGAVVSEVRYHPYGEERWANGEAVTDFGFTSQRNEASFGLMDYNARYYSPRLGRFVSPDSIVPEPGSSGGWNRYAYVSNNPLRYIDPAGHQGCTPGDQACWDTEWYRARGYEQQDGQWQYTGSFSISEDNPDFYTNGVKDPDKIKKEIKGVAETTWESFGTVEAMARAVELGAALAGSDANLFMEYISPVLSGRTRSGMLGFNPAPQDPTYYSGLLDNTGFANAYADPNPDGNQANHVWFYAQLTYYSSVDIALIANTYHEFIQRIPDRHGQSVQDFNAGLYGIVLGFSLKSGLMSPHDVGNSIRSELGQQTGLTRLTRGMRGSFVHTLPLYVPW